jgi:hypothetical protein
MFRRNAYRVLLTRARQGIVLFVPSGDANDPSRNPGELSATADFLMRCGATIPTRASAVASSESVQTVMF